MTIKLLQCRFRYSAQAAITGVLVLAFSLVQPAAAQRGAANVYYPPSSIERPQDLGKFAHTNYVLYSPTGGRPVGAPSPDFSQEETPSTMQCLLGLISSASGDPYLSCNKSRLGTRHAVGGWGAIALVDAFDDPTAASDLAFFARQYSLQRPTSLRSRSTHHTGIAAPAARTYRPTKAGP